LYLWLRHKVEPLSGHWSDTEEERQPREEDKCMAASAVLAKKYGVMRSLFHFVRNVRCVLQWKANVEVVYIAIDPISA
jgi:hypothetical protein